MPKLNRTIIFKVSDDVITIIQTDKMNANSIEEKIKVNSFLSFFYFILLLLISFLFKILYLLLIVFYTMYQSI